MHARTRRTAALTAAAVAAAGSVAFLSGPASAAPADPDITGTVVNSAGAPLGGVFVTAYTTPADGSRPLAVSGETTNAAGAYTFTDLDPASLATSTNPAIATETEFKLFFEWEPSVPTDFHSVGYLNRGLGGSKTYRAAGSVVVPANAVATAPTQALPTAGGVLVMVTGPTGAPVNDYGSANLFAPDAYDPLDAGDTGASTLSDDGFYVAPATAPDDGLVYVDQVEPGTYVVNAGGSDYNATLGLTTNYLSRFFGGDGSYTDAKTVEVKAGAFTPVAVQLTDKLTALQEPRIIGNSSIGSKLKADPGTWLRQQGTEFTYQWLRNKELVATGDTYKVTKKDQKKKLQLVVTAYNGQFIGTATSDKTSKVGQKSKLTVKKAGDGRYALSVKVQKKALAGKIKVSGKVMLMTEDGQAASRKVKLKGASAIVKVKAKYAGEKLVAVYLGNNRLGSDTAAIGGKKKK